MIEHVVLLEVARVVHEVVVDGEVAHLYCLPGDDRLEVDGLYVARAGINLAFIHFVQGF